MRGEYCLPPYLRNFCRELPPRARRIPGWAIGLDKLPGTTSACAENTGEISWPHHGSRNYLRVRGEYCLAHCSMSFPMELPPRARRIQPVLPKNWFVQGTTSACAENTGLDHLANSIDRNYLRVRGEYPKQCHKERLIRELPPRARRIRFGLSSRSVAHGTTSACAENTRFSSTALPTVRNYLRVRGEYFTAFTQSGSCRELPPRARRILAGAWF